MTIRRVLMTTDTLGGSWSYTLQLCRALLAHDVEIVLVTFGPDLSWHRQREASALGNIRLLHRSYRLEWDNPAEDLQHAGQWLLQLEQEWNPEVCHINGYAHAALPFSAPKVVVAHSCVFSWWQAVRGGTPPRSWTSYHHGVRKALRSAQAVVAPTRWMLRELEKSYGTVPDGRVIPHSVAAEPRHTDDKEEIVLAAGRAWDAAKNLEVLNTCAPAIPWPVYVAGPCMRSRTGSNMERCYMLGDVDTRTTGQWLARSSIFALPSLYEPFGITTVEAALAGCALVVSDIPAQRETWGDAAAFVDPHDADAWAWTLRLLATDGEHRQRLARAAREHAARYSPHHQAQAYLNLYEDLVQQPHRASRVS